MIFPAPSNPPAPLRFLIGLLIAFVSRDASAVPLPPFPADAPVLDATSLGADPTGRADSSDAIEAAIRQVEEGHFRVRWVHLPAGTYRVTRPIVGGRFVTLIGAVEGKGKIPARSNH